ncbi:MAG: VWA domain-containing protein [Synergistaceae bacterium]|jgi:Ca-activated chloride channel family protein|nr:VWA domain-containing protein [Synergistaceae bacterium]
MSRKLRLLVLAFAMLVFPETADAEEIRSVVLKVGADAPVVGAGGSRRVTVRALVYPAAPVPERRASLAAALVIDKSGSMGSDKKMENAKRGALEALRVLDSHDMAAVIVYDDESSVLVPAGPAGDYTRFERKISRIGAGGNTALYDGVGRGADEIARFVEKGYVPRVILLSDGLANVGPSSVEELTDLARRLARRDMTITTIGLGLDYDEDAMTALASQSGGNAYFAKNSAALSEIFLRDMKDAVALSGRRVKATLFCDGGTKPIRTLGRKGSVKDNVMETDIGNLYGAEKYALFELEVPEGRNGTALRAGMVRVEYIDAVSGSSVTLESPLDIRYEEDPFEVAENRDVEIAYQAEMARNAEVREEAVRLADDGRAEDASNLLRRRADYLKFDVPLPAPLKASDEMKDDISDFDELAEYMTENESMSAEQRKSSLNKAHVTKNQQSDVNERSDKDEGD